MFSFSPLFVLVTLLYAEYTRFSPAITEFMGIFRVCVLVCAHNMYIVEINSFIGECLIRLPFRVPEVTFSKVWGLGIITRRIEGFSCRSPVFSPNLRPPFCVLRELGYGREDIRAGLSMGDMRELCGRISRRISPTYVPYIPEFFPLPAIENFPGTQDHENSTKPSTDLFLVFVRANNKEFQGLKYSVLGN